MFNKKIKERIHKIEDRLKQQENPPKFKPGDLVFYLYKIPSPFIQMFRCGTIYGHVWAQGKNLYSIKEDISFYPAKIYLISEDDIIGLESVKEKIKKFENFKKIKSEPGKKRNDTGTSNKISSGRS